MCAMRLLLSDVAYSMTTDELSRRTGVSRLQLRQWLACGYVLNLPRVERDGLRMRLLWPESSPDEIAALAALLRERGHSFNS